MSVLELKKAEIEEQINREAVHFGLSRGGFEVKVPSNRLQGVELAYEYAFYVSFLCFWVCSVCVLCVIFVFLFYIMRF